MNPGASGAGIVMTFGNNLGMSPATDPFSFFLSFTLSFYLTVYLLIPDRLYNVELHEDRDVVMTSEHPLTMV